MTRLLTSKEYAAKLGIRDQTARRQRMTGRGPRFLRLGTGPSGRAFYKEEDVVTWLAEQPTFSSTLQEKMHLLDSRDGGTSLNRHESVPSARATSDEDEPRADSAPRKGNAPPPNGGTEANGSPEEGDANGPKEGSGA